MKKWFLILSFFTTALFAETIGNVEYSFPGSWKEWELINEINEEEMFGYLYTLSSEDGIEFFGANTDSVSTDLPDKDAFVEGLQAAYPGQKIAAKIIHSNRRSILLEWTMSDEKEILLQGFCRIFSSEKGNVVLTYMTTRNKYVKTLRPVWLKMMKEAKLLP